MGNEERKTIENITDSMHAFSTRFDEVEKKLDKALFGDLDSDGSGILTRVRNLEKRMDEISESSRWLFRTVAASAIAILLSQLLSLTL